jgi:hypothetical protein
MPLGREFGFNEAGGFLSLSNTLYRLLRTADRFLEDDVGVVLLADVEAETSEVQGEYSHYTRQRVPVSQPLQTI